RHVAPHDLAQYVGYVFQDPESQIVTELVEDDIVFTMEQLGVPRRVIRKRIDRIAAQLGITHVMQRPTATLSGGERQMVAIAGAIAHQPRIVILDEPTSQLDATNARRIVESIQQLSQECGVTTIIAEHRIERVLPIISQHTALSAGRLVFAPLLSDTDERDALEPSGDASAPGQEVLTASDVEFGYEEESLFTDVSFILRGGETVALSGPNGSGKTTILKLLCGLLQPRRGGVDVGGRPLAGRSIQEIGRLVGYVPQQPTSILHQETLLDELQFTLRAQDRSGNPHRLLDHLGIATFSERHPLDLSGGERQRAAVAAIGVSETPILLLDEPTRGLSVGEKRLLAAYLGERAARGLTTVIATHDEAFIRSTAHRQLTIDQGTVRSRPAEARSESDERGRTNVESRILTG
ncbi:MAG: ABC transporter ATP-binding protein, partial [Chloroflexota bacterium]